MITRKQKINLYAEYAIYIFNRVNSSQFIPLENCLVAHMTDIWDTEIDRFRGGTNITYLDVGTRLIELEEKLGELPFDLANSITEWMLSKV